MIAGYPNCYLSWPLIVCVYTCTLAIVHMQLLQGVQEGTVTHVRGVKH
jgi:hypothetical protein